MSPFQALYGYLPPHLSFLSNDTTSVAAVETYLKTRDYMIDIIEESLQQAQDRMKLYADSTRVERSFAEGDLFYIDLQPYRQASLYLRKNFKLSAKYYGSFKVLQKIGAVVYNFSCHLMSAKYLSVHVSLLLVSVHLTVDVLLV
ncbi:uncharacterized protein LOC113311378 [Papaver somniferum]|uniref:uncharacterized protein LOC113311378 n=1 Tax=Papaver somniferum TaxID=3469 RepID=UPI000E6F940D|nr:uncharacterized protein LOC113311378 [Papaver somniferum]